MCSVNCHAFAAARAWRARALLAPLICLFTALSAARCSCKRARKSSKVDAIARFYRQRIDALLALEQPSWARAKLFLKTPRLSLANVNKTRAYVYTYTYTACTPYELWLAPIEQRLTKPITPCPMRLSLCPNLLR